ncbi:MAG: hypothetical protein PSN34_12415 [Urechidicola sp.]|nr:hypothetical protein [Urechidicola sp.]
MKLKILLIVLITTQILISQNNSSKEINRNGYSISYPSELRLDESSRNGTEFSLFTEKTDITDDFVENINLIIQDLKGMNIDLDNYVEITENQVRHNGKLIFSGRIISNENSEFHKFIYELKIGNRNLTAFQYAFVKTEKAYILTFTSESSEYDKYLEKMKYIMDSFKLNEQH